MKNCNNIVGLLCLIFLIGLLTSTSAQAFYNPQTGHWLDRDPLGESGFKVMRKDNSVVKSDCSNLYGFVFNEPESHYDLLGLDCPGCDYLTAASPFINAIISIKYGVDPGPLFRSPCALRACAQHDNCYCQNQCTMESWGSTLSKLMLQSLGVSVTYTPCEQCNINVVDYMVACVVTHGNNNSGDPQYFCAKQGKFITIPGDFPTLLAAKCACCGSCKK